MNVTGIQRENLIGTDFSIYFTEPAPDKLIFKYLKKALSLTML
jgi:hypothetical protein